MREVKYIIVHCTATPEGREVTVPEINRWHKQRGFKSIGYHYVIYLDGSIHKGRSETVIGAHCKGYNDCSIGVAYVGGLTRDGKESCDTRTQKQKDALEHLLKELKKKYPKAVIKGHRDFSPDLDGDGEVEPEEWIKDCPCFDVVEEYKNL